jgi:hypothetical protein
MASNTKHERTGTTQAIRGRCLCGAVRFVARGRPNGVFWCHCESCRRHSGAPVSVFVAFRRDAYRVTKGKIAKHKSSPGTTRGFCRTCGSTLTCESVKLPTETHFHVGAFEKPDKLVPSKHFFRNEQLPWLHLA